MLHIRTILAATLAAIMPKSLTENGIKSLAPDMHRKVSFIYLVPKDRTESKTYQDNILFAAKHFQSWLGKRLNGKTFHLFSPEVMVVKSNKTAKWFSSSERYSGYSAFYRNTLEELIRLGIAQLNDPQTRYMIYVDSDHACGQSGAGGSGLAVVSANDLRGLSGESIVPACEKLNGAEVPGRCRWIGGMGHELLHTLGLPHSDRSHDCQTAQCRSNALMMYGYVTYPNSFLLAEEVYNLTLSPFITDQNLSNDADCK